MTKPSAVTDCFQAVQDYLLLMDVSFTKREDGDIIEVLFVDAPRLVIAVISLDGEPFVVVRSYLVTGANTSGDLYPWLLRRNYDLILGKLCLDDDDDIVIEHVLGGADLDQSELSDAIYALAIAGENVRKELQQRYGGTLLN